MKWSRVDPAGDAPVPRFGHSLHAISENELVLFGGFEQDLTGSSNRVPFAQWSYSGKLSNEVFVFNTHANEWRRVPPAGDVPPGLVFHASCVNRKSNELTVHGGFLDNAFKSISEGMYCLDLTTYTWRKVPLSGRNVPSARACHGLAFNPSSNSMFLFGDDMIDDNRLYEISFSAEGAADCRQLDVSGTGPQPRRFLTLETVGNRLYCFGGETPLHGITDVYVYTIGSESGWSKPLYEGSLSLRCQTACVMNDKLMIFGGIKEKASLVVMGGSDVSIAKKLFFLNVLEIKDSPSENEVQSFPSSQFKFKVVTVGDSGVGKSCLLTRFVSDVYSDFHVSTIGVDYKTVVTMVKGKLVKLLLWDTAGQERFSVVTGNYYRNADGFVIVYDATNRKSFEHVEQWILQIKQHHECGPDTVKILIGNKHDLVREVVVSETEGKAKADSLGAIFVAASAKTSSNVDMAFLTCAQKLVEIRKTLQQQAPPTTRPSSPGLLNLGRTPSSTASPSNCCN